MLVIVHILSIVIAHMQAAQAMSAYSDWAPPQYQEDAQQAQAAAPAAAGTQQATTAAHASAAPAAEGQAAAENGTAATSGFTYDSNSGTVPGQTSSSLSVSSGSFGRCCQLWAENHLQCADVACTCRILL